MTGTQRTAVIIAVLLFGAVALAVGNETLALAALTGALGLAVPSVAPKLEKAGLDKVVALALVCGLLSLTACGRLPQTPGERCDRITAKYRAWGAVSIGAAAFAGAGGLATAVPDDKVPRLAIGGTSLAVAIASGIASWLQGQYHDQLAAQCSTAPTPAPTKADAAAIAADAEMQAVQLEHACPDAREALAAYRTERNAKRASRGLRAAYVVNDAASDAVLRQRRCTP